MSKQISESVEDLDIVIDDLFKDPEESLLPDDTSNDDDVVLKPENMTENVTKRINKVRTETELETKNRVAEELGYESYELMKKAQEEKIAKDYGFDKEDIEAVLEPMLKQRLADDPRFRKLEEFEQREKDLYVKTQLASINEATGQKLTIKDLDQKTLDLWGKGIELEDAYYATHGKTILNKKVSKLENGTLSHLAPGSSSGATKTRVLTEDEKEMWRAIVPGITDQELSKKTVKIN